MSTTAIAQSHLAPTTTKLRSLFPYSLIPLFPNPHKNQYTELTKYSITLDPITKNK